MSNHAVQPQETWHKYHATKLEDYLTCPRYAFYRQIIGWQKESTRNHLAFGSAWHELQEVLLRQGYTAEALAAGMDAFLLRYRRAFGPETDELFTPKTPSTALTAAAHYIMEYAEKDRNQKVLHLETCGAVPVSADRVIRFKMDSILEDARGVFSREHKTGSSSGRQWMDKWLLAMQVGTYTHALYCLYPQERVWGVEVSGTFFLKTKINFARVPCRASMPMLNAWLYDVNNWLDRFEADVDRLMTEDSEASPVMASFPRNPLSCTNYYGCEYHPFCLSWANPLQHLDDIPMGFYQEFWDPEKTTEDKDLLEEKENLGVLR